MASGLTILGGLIHDTCLEFVQFDSGYTFLLFTKPHMYICYCLPAFHDNLERFTAMTATNLKVFI